MDSGPDSGASTSFGIHQMAERVWRFSVPLNGHPLGQMNSYAIDCGPGIVMIDVGWTSPTYAGSLERALRDSLGAALHDVSHIFVTHSHADHCGAVGELMATGTFRAAMTGADATALHRRYFDREFAEREGRCWLGIAGAPARAERHILAHGGRASTRMSRFRPDLEVEHDDEIVVGSTTVRVIETPGHTVGHANFAVDGIKVLFTGDHVLRKGYAGPAYAPPMSDGDVASSLRSMDRLAGLDDYLVLPGHGESFRGLDARIEQIRDYHRRRSSDVLEVLRASPCTAWQIASRMSWKAPWERLGTAVQVSAAGQVMAYLAALESSGEARRRGSQWTAS